MLELDRFNIPKNVLLKLKVIYCKTVCFVFSRLLSQPLSFHSRDKKNSSLTSAAPYTSKYIEIQLNSRKGLVPPPPLQPFNFWKKIQFNWSSDVVIFILLLRIAGKSNRGSIFFKLKINLRYFLWSLHKMNLSRLKGSVRKNERGCRLTSKNIR